MKATVSPLNLILRAALFILPTTSSPVRRNNYSGIKTTTTGGFIYELGDVSYFANSKHPQAELLGNGLIGQEGTTPITVIVSNTTVITGKYLMELVSSYLSGDDVFNNDFLASVYISSSSKRGSIDPSGLQYLSSLGVENLYLESSLSSRGGLPKSLKTAQVHGSNNGEIPSGPYTAIISKGNILLLKTYRLYRDEYRDFITGAYATEDNTGSYSALGVMDSQYWDPMIPVPSRIYSWNDKRDLAGTRVAIKDLYDIKGLQTSGGSQAWIRVTPIANTTAPAIQRLVDLGAVLVGKFKLAQFASGANPWAVSALHPNLYRDPTDIVVDWVDEHYPFNPRGDGYLTCSASSSGGGCSVAAYDWLDNAIGSDTGSSMRRPAAVSGTYGNRPSQGMIALNGVIPLSFTEDTAGVFSRDPLQWVKFAKAWYSPSLHQDTSITGLPNLDVKDTDKFPKRILYLDDYLPLANPAAQIILQDFLGRVTKIFGMTIEHSNLTNTIKTSSIYSNVAPENNFAYYSNMTSTFTGYTQQLAVSGPLVRAWASLFDGRFPPVDPQWRSAWRSYTSAVSDPVTLQAGKVVKNDTIEWFNKNVLFETEGSCSEAVMICDIGTGGLPSFREEDLNVAPNATLLAVLPAGAAITCANICPRFGCADYTIPIGQVSYFSPVTAVTEYIPVTINMIVKRGCDFMLFNMIEKLAKEGVLQTVKTGRTAF